MRVDSAPINSQRLRSKNRRTDGGEGASMPDTLNRFFSANSHAHSKKDDVHGDDSFDDILLQYPVKNNYNIIESKPMSRHSFHSLSFSSAYMLISSSNLSNTSDTLSLLPFLSSGSIDDIHSLSRLLLDYSEFVPRLGSLYSLLDCYQTDIDFAIHSFQSSHSFLNSDKVDSTDGDSSSNDSVDSDGSHDTDSDTDNPMDSLVGWIHGDLYWEPVGLRPCSKFGSKYHCFNRSCQRCWIKWRDRVVYEVTQRLTSAEKNSLRHVTFSPAQDWGLERLKSVGGFDYLRTKAYEVMKEAGVDGAIVVFHPWRVKTDVKEIIEETTTDTRVWTYLRSHDLLTQDSDAIELSPHFHVLGLGYLKKSSYFYEDTKWIYNNHGDFDRLEHELKYLLSHTGLAYSIDDTEKTLFKSYSSIGDFIRGGGK